MTSKQKLKNINYICTFIMLNSKNRQIQTMMDIIMYLCTQSKKDIEANKDKLNKDLKEIGFPDNLMI